MNEVNLLEGVLLSDEQIEMLAFMIKPEDIKNYINEHKKDIWQGSGGAHLGRQR